MLIFLQMSQHILLHTSSCHIYISHFIIFFVAGLYLHAVTETKLVVDTSRGETLRINVRMHLTKEFYFIFSDGDFLVQFQFFSLIEDQLIFQSRQLQRCLITLQRNFLFNVSCMFIGFFPLVLLLDKLLKQTARFLFFVVSYLGTYFVSFLCFSITYFHSVTRHCSSYLCTDH